MPRRRTAETAAIRFDVVDRAEAISAITGTVAEAGGRIRTLATVRLDRRRRRRSSRSSSRSRASSEDALVAALEGLEDVRAVHRTQALGTVFGKRIIVVGGGAQVAQVALGAVSEADRHNLRGERISVDTIPLVGEAHIAAAVRAVADLPRARLLVLAGSIMGGDISVAAEELRAVGIPIIALNMVGSITEHVDLVVSDPVQAGHDGRDGRRRHGHLRPRAPARPAVLSVRCASPPGTSTRSRPARRPSRSG